VKDPDERDKDISIDDNELMDDNEAE